MASPVIALLTDFGERDGFVGTLKGVLYSLLKNPATPVVDISHQVAPQNIQQASWILNNSAPYFPEHTIFICVVDPHVGDPVQTKLLLYCKHRKHFFIGPDNGLFTPILQALSGHIEAYRIQNPRYFRTAETTGISQTFHGRDIYAPVGAHLANALTEETWVDFLRNLGPIEDHPFTFEISSPVLREESTHVSATGHIAHIDLYGNLITDLPNQWLKKEVTSLKIKIGQPAIDFSSQHVSCYNDGQSFPNQVLAIPGSHGSIELALYQKSAQQHCHAICGDPVALQWIKESRDKENIQIV